MKKFTKGRKGKPLRKGATLLQPTPIEGKQLLAAGCWLRAKTAAVGNWWLVIGKPKKQPQKQNQTQHQNFFSRESTPNERERGTGKPNSTFSTTEDTEEH